MRLCNTMVADHFMPAYLAALDSASRWSTSSPPSCRRSCASRTSSSRCSIIQLQVLQSGSCTATFQQGLRRPAIAAVWSSRAWRGHQAVGLPSMLAAGERVA